MPEMLDRWLLAERSAWTPAELDELQPHAAIDRLVDVQGDEIDFERLGLALAGPFEPGFLRRRASESRRVS